MSHVEENDRQELQRRLDSIADKGKAVITSWRKKKCFHQALSRVLRYFYLFPLAVWGWYFVGKITGAVSFDFSLPLFFLVTFLLTGVYFGLTYFIQSMSLSVSRKEALVFCDQRLGVKDRLVAADEFLGKPDGNRFKQAAVADAVEKAKEVQSYHFDPILSSFQNQTSQLTGPIIGLAAMVLLFFLLTPPNPIQQTPDTVLDTGSVKKTSNLQKNPTKKEKDEKQVLDPLVRPEKPKDQGIKSQSSKSRKAKSQEKSPSAERSESFQKNGGNQSSQTETSASSNGTGNNPQPQSGQNEDEKKKNQTPKQKRKPSGKKKPSKNRKPKPQKPSGVMSGKGTGKASSSENEDLPSFPKAAKATSNPEDDGDDSDADDEDEQQKSESGNKPTLNNKKPAPSREAGGISPPPGDQQSKSKKPPQRGGRSGVKKSRGVPSAILGVPTPDRLTGTPNASRFKIKQEESSPKEEVAAKVEAQSRLTRTGLIGGLPQPKIPLWQQRIIEKYFRQKQSSSTQTENNK